MLDFPLEAVSSTNFIEHLYPVLTNAEATAKKVQIRRAPLQWTTLFKDIVASHKRTEEQQMHEAAKQLLLSMKTSGEPIGLSN